MKALADTITLGNGLAGFMSMLYSLDRDFSSATLFLVLAMILDGLDGKIARLSDKETEYGRYLDAIADTVSFCFAPAVLIYSQFYDLGKGSALMNLDNAVVVGVSLLIAGLGMLRLARFVEKTHTFPYYLGLPTAVVALVALLLSLGELTWGGGAFLLVILIPLCLMMLTSIKFPKLGTAGSVIAVTVLASIMAYVLLDGASSLLLAYALCMTAAYIFLGPLIVTSR